MCALLYGCSSPHMKVFKINTNKKEKNDSNKDSKDTKDNNITINDSFVWHIPKSGSKNIRGNQ